MSTAATSLSFGEERELLELICALRDQSLSPEQAARLDEMVVTNPAARRVYLKFADLHASLRWCAAAPDFRQPALGQPTQGSAGPGLAPADPKSPLLAFLTTSLRFVLPGSTVTPLWLFALGAVLATVSWAVVAIWIFPGWREADEERAVASVAAAPAARLTATHACQWLTETALPLGSPLDARPLELVAGTAEITFASGVSVVVEGPAVFRVDGTDRLDFRRGQLVAEVPSQAHGFAVKTPTAEVIDLGTEFGISVDQQGATDLHVIRGRVEIKPASQAVVPAGAPLTRLSAGEAVRLSAGKTAAAPIPYDGGRFAATRSAVAAKPPGEGKFHGVQPIWLGNLFDDRPHLALADAMKTDTYRAEADFNDLGVSRVVYGGDSVAEVAPDIQFDLTPLGWSGSPGNRVANDAIGATMSGEPGGLRLAGHATGLRDVKIEEGIGMHADAYLTFSLLEIRAAGKLENRPLVFVCDRAGVNDDVIGNIHGGGGVHLAVLLSTRNGVQKALVDGVAGTIDQQQGHWFLTSKVGDPLTSGGRTFAVHEPLPLNIEYVTLICASAGDGVHADHGAWIGARLEIAPK